MASVDQCWAKFDEKVVNLCESFEIVVVQKCVNRGYLEECSFFLPFFRSRRMLLLLFFARIGVDTAEDELSKFRYLLTPHPQNSEYNHMLGSSSTRQERMGHSIIRCEAVEMLQLCV